MFYQPLTGFSYRISVVLTWFVAKFHTSFFKKDQDRRQSTDVKEGTHKTGSF